MNDPDFDSLHPISMANLALGNHKSHTYNWHTSVKYKYQHTCWIYIFASWMGNHYSPYILQCIHHQRIALQIDKQMEQNHMESPYNIK